MYEAREGEQIKQGGDTWLFPTESRFINPPLTLGNHAPSQFGCSEHSWLGYLIKMHSYMMPQLNICHMSRYTIGDNSNPKHNITKSMVAPWPLAPHHDYLQYIYIYIMYI